MATSSPYIKELKDSVKPPKKVPRRALFTRNPKKHDQRSDSSSDSDVDDMVLGNDSDDTDWDKPLAASDEEIEKEFEFKKLLSYKEGDYVLVELSSKKSVQRFTAKVVKDSSNDVEVSFMRKYRNHYNIFVEPDVKEERSILLCEILGKLTAFRVLRRGQIMFL